MTAENVKKSIKHWITSQIPVHPDLTDIPVYISGEHEDAEFPCIVIADQSTEQVIENGVIMRGVDSIELTVELHTVPVDEDQAGTSIEDHRSIMAALYNCMADDDAIAFCDGLNGTAVFDFRTQSPTMATDPPRRASTIQMTAIACPI